MNINGIGGCLIAAAIMTALPAFGLEINVKDAGARGDGVTDDSAVLVKATEQIEKNGGGLLYLPQGIYRFAAHQRGAIAFKATSNVTVRFDAGAVLLMDNLLKDGQGGGHGVVITGPCRNITLENVCVQWKDRPSTRSMGDGFRFEGYPDDAQTVANIRMVHCRTIGAPQTGAVFMGCSDIFVNDFSPVNTLADGLHFNACRRVHVNGVIGVNTADDTLAFVTYYSKKPMGVTGSVFSRPALNEWCNSDSTACNIISSGGTADGLRISGSRNITVNNIVVTGKWCGIQLDAAQASENRKVGWSYLASRGISISNAIVRRCGQGLLVRSLNIPIDAPAARWEFDVHAANFQITECKEIGVDIRNAAGVTLSGFSTDSGMTLLNARGLYDLKDIRVSNSQVLIHGIQGKTFSGYNPGNMEPLPIKVKDDLSDLAEGDIVMTDVSLHNAPLTIEAVAGLRVSDLKCSGNSPLSLTACRNCRFLGLELGRNAVKTEHCTAIELPEAAKDSAK